MEDHDVHVMSVMNEKLLIGRSGGRSLFVCEETGKYIEKINIKNFNDAIWTRNGNIVIANGAANNIVLYSTFEKKIIHETQMKKPLMFSVFNKSIFLADSESGVFQSTDDGITWNLVFQISDKAAGWQCWQMIVADAKDSVFNYWVCEKNKELYRLRIYASKTLQVKDLDVSVYVNLKTAYMAFDGKSSVLLCDNEKCLIHIFSISGEYQRQLIMNKNDGQVTNPRRPYFDSIKQLLYVGMSSNELKIYTLTYSTS